MPLWTVLHGFDSRCRRRSDPGGRSRGHHHRDRRGAQFEAHDPDRRERPVCPALASAGNLCAQRRSQRISNLRQFAVHAPGAAGGHHRRRPFACIDRNCRGGDRHPAHAQYDQRRPRTGGRKHLYPLRADHRPRGDAPQLSHPRPHPGQHRSRRRQPELPHQLRLQRRPQFHLRRLHRRRGGDQPGEGRQQRHLPRDAPQRRNRAGVQGPDQLLQRGIRQHRRHGRQRGEQERHQRTSRIGIPGTTAATSSTPTASSPSGRAPLRCRTSREQVRLRRRRAGLHSQGLQRQEPDLLPRQRRRGP